MSSPILDINWQAIDAQNSLLGLVKYHRKGYQIKWYHKIIANKLEAVLKGEIKRLMIFVPPQHGKSELASRYFPAYALGKNPDSKIIHTALYCWGY